MRPVWSRAAVYQGEYLGKYPGYKIAYPGYENLNIRSTRITISGEGVKYPKYEGMKEGIKIWCTIVG